MPKLYFDTNVLHYLGRTFATNDIAPDIAENLLIAPISLLELLSQLGTGDAESAFQATQALLHLHNKKATGLLPWSDDLFRMALFNQTPAEDVITPVLNNAVNNVLSASRAAELRADGQQMRALLDQCKAQAVKEFLAVLEAWRIEGALGEEVHREIFARSIARRAGVDPSIIDVEHVIASLNAYYTFENQRMQSGAENREYNARRRANDVYDAELLIYLAEPSFHFVTSDRAFGRVRGSTQAGRVHIVNPALLETATEATSILRGFLNS